MVGALLVGGATTGTTLAHWRDQAALGASSVKGGTIGLTVNGSTSASFGSLANLTLNSGATAGGIQSATATLVNTSTGKNMRMQMHLDNVTATTTGLTNGLEVAASTVATGVTCPSPAGTFKPLSSYTTTPLTATSLSPGGTRKLCVDVRVKGGAGSTAAGQDGTLTFTFRGEQVRP